MARPLTLWLVAGEESGDQLGAGLMRALRARLGPDGVRFAGVGGGRMAGEGLESLFAMSDIAVMGIGAVVARLPLLLRRIRETAAAAVSARPDGLVIIDSPDFTHRVARRVRAAMPDLAIVNYVSPSVWAWRPGRAPRMRPYVDHVLALKPFEVDAHRRLGGPDCTYVGHPLTERLDELRPAPGERAPIGGGPLRLLVLPGSRRTEIARLMGPFGGALERLSSALGREVEATLPAVPHLADEIARVARRWPIRPRIVHGEAAKFAAFRSAHVALAASGTVTLELALGGVPMVVAYRVSKLEEQLKYVITAPSIVLANLVIGENVIPELLQWQCEPVRIVSELAPLCADTPERRRQLDAFARLDALMDTGDETPSERAARIVLETVAGKRDQAAVSSGRVAT
jgi:lipid-A-disaccharide synthase